MGFGEERSLKESNASSERRVPHDFITRLADYVWLDDFHRLIYSTWLSKKERKRLEDAGFVIEGETDDLEDLGYCRSCCGMDDEFYTVIQSQIVEDGWTGLSQLGKGHPKSSITYRRQFKQ